MLSQYHHIDVTKLGACSGYQVRVFNNYYLLIILSHDINYESARCKCTVNLNFVYNDKHFILHKRYKVRSM